jgi:hypothetical protein
LGRMRELLAVLCDLDRLVKAQVFAETALPA